MEINVATAVFQVFKLSYHNFDSFSPLNPVHKGSSDAMAIPSSVLFSSMIKMFDFDLNNYPLDLPPTQIIGIPNSH